MNEQRVNCLQRKAIFENGAIVGLSLTTVASFILHFQVSIISSGLELGIFGHNFTFLERAPKDVEKMKPILIYSENKNNEDNRWCQETFNINNIEDYEFMTERYLSMTYRNFESRRIFIEMLPIFSGYVSVIMVMMMFIYHTGSRKKSWGVPQPWRIVVPSIFIFLTMMIMTLTYAIISQKHIFNICKSINSKLKQPEAFRCATVLQMMGKHIRKNYTCYNVYMKLFEIFSILLPILWGVLCLIMILRIFLGVDFTLVNVVLSAYKPVKSITIDEDWSDKRLAPSKGHSHFPTSKKTSEFDGKSVESSKSSIHD